MPESDPPIPHHPEPPPPPPDKPWPPIGDDAKVFALLVGINNYPGAAELNGCIKDIESVENYLKANHTQVPAAANDTPQLEQPDSSGGVAVQVAEQTATEIAPNILVEEFGNLYLCKLLDEQATYENVITAFRKFLRFAKGKDTVWFHFSGHGTQQLTANEFLPFEPNGKDQALVCHYTSEVQEAPFLLADKELGRLIEEVATLNIDGTTQEKTSPHIVATLDCCHSGTGTRDFNGQQPNNTPSNPNLPPPPPDFDPRALDLDIPRRDINKYLMGAFKNDVRISNAQHASISACNSTEKAGDTLNGGFFTNNLIKALQESNGEISYVDLATKTRLLVKKERKDQTPQFDTINRFNPYTKFLDGKEVIGRKDLHRVYSIEGRGGKVKWRIDCGAVHNLPTSSDFPISVEIYDQEGKMIGEAEVAEVGAFTSRLNVPESLPLDPTLLIGYKGLTIYMPEHALEVKIIGDSEAVDQLIEKWDHTKNIVPVREKDAVVKYEVAIQSDGGFHIRNKEDKDFLFDTNILLGASANEDQQVETLQITLERIAHWERVALLDNVDSPLKSMLKMEMEVQDKKGDITTHKGNQVDLVIIVDEEEETEDGVISDDLGFRPAITINRSNAPMVIKGQDLHFYLFHMDNDYTIHEWNVLHNNASEDVEGENETIKLDDEFNTWGVPFSSTDNHASCIFKVLVTTRPIVYQNLLQPGGLTGDRQVKKRFNAGQNMNDWCCLTMKVDLTRKMQG